MHRSVAIVLVLQAFYLAIISANICEIPENLTDVDWLTFEAKQKWYRSMTTNDSFAEAMSCEVFYHVVEICPGKISIEAIYFDRSYSPLHVLITVERQRSGVYRVKHTNAPDDLETVVKHSKYVDNTNVAVEADTMLAEEFFYLTDSKTYFIFVFCNKGGHWNVWTFSPNITPTPEDVINSQVALNNHGIKVDLHFNNDCERATTNYCRICD